MTDTNQQATRRSILQPHLERLLDSREHPKTICPSEVARALSSQELLRGSFLTWRDAMSEIRTIVAEMRARGEVEVLQKGSVLEGDLGEGLVDVAGPVRVRKVV
jgi:hypothetical protein